MEVVAITKYVRIQPGKARDLIRQIHGLRVAAALQTVQFSGRKAAVYIGKTLKSAIANAENNNKLSVDDLWVKSAVIDEGPRLKRHKARARGSASPLQKKMSHVRIILSDEKK